MAGLGSGQVVLVGEQFELDHGVGIARADLPAPGPSIIRLELGVAERPLEPSGVDRPLRDLEIDLHVDVGGTRVRLVRPGAQQVGDETSARYELRGTSAVVGHATHHMPGSLSTGWLMLAVAAKGKGRRVSRPPEAGSRSASLAAATSPRRAGRAWPGLE